MKDENTLKALFSDSSRADGLGSPDLTQPLYQVVKREIFDAIMMGKWPAGTVLPGEVALAQSLRVSVGTVRRALSELTNEGMLSRRRKTGTIVTGRTPQHSLRFFFQYFRLHGLDGSLQHSQARNLSLAHANANEDEAHNLGLEVGAPVARLARLRSIEGIPVMVDAFVLPKERVPNFPQQIENVPALLYLYLLERFDIRICAIREKIGADLATDEDAKHLQLELPAALLTLEEIGYDQSGNAVIYAHHRATTKSHRYVNELQ